MDKKNLKTRIMRASGKGCVAAVFAERSSMACVPAFMETCEAAGIKPAAGVRMMVEATGVRGELLFLVKDRAGYREICHLLSDTLAKDDPVVTMEMIGQGHVIIVHEKNGLFDKILMRNKESQLLGYRITEHAEMYGSVICSTRKGMLTRLSATELTASML